MEKSDELFYTIIKTLHEEEVLKQLMLTGGWCQRLYTHYFKNPLEISALRTADVDFIVKRPIISKKKIDLPEILNKIGFEEVFSTPSGYIKYLHRDLEIEFLISEIGRGSDKPYILKHLQLNAQRLRYLDILEKYPLEVDFYGIKTTVPHPAAFVINKFIVSQRRKNKSKSEKDIIAAKETGEYILNDEYQKAILKEVYESLAVKTQNKLIKIIKTHSNLIYIYLTE
jgi:hypothetical protein